MVKNYINLINQLSFLDKKRIENFINDYGVKKEYFEGLEKWLQNWSHSNQKLYKLLGNNFIYKIPYDYTKPKEELAQEINNKLRNHPFDVSYTNFYLNYICQLEREGEIDSNNKLGFCSAFDFNNFINDKINFGIKCKRKEKKKILQIQAGTKPIKALQKIVEYFDDIYNFEGFENFKKLHSLILNNKKLKGNLCISIHPLDFLTMSDNNSGWSSCMSWTKEGCYKVGTIEMMNSNNVLCCYLEAEDPFTFGAKGEEFKWNNKKWRNLVYVTKDIIVSGKSYPYMNEDMSKILIHEIKKLAKDNLNWNYQFGPELYQDMTHIDSEYKINMTRHYIRTHTTKKHNILFDTNGMYNDIFNNNMVNYWCYRNKVKHNKVISISGKTPCLCCGNPIIEYNEDNFDEDYNERFINCSNVICSDCINTKFLCEKCYELNPTNTKYVKIKTESEEFLFCEKCAKKYIKYCPDCHTPMLINSFHNLFTYKLPKEKDKLSKEKDTLLINYCEELKSNDHNSKNLYCTPVCCCKDCMEKHITNLELVEVPFFWGRETIHIFKDNKVNDKYLYNNLKEVPEEVYSTQILKYAANSNKSYKIVTNNFIDLH